MSFHESCENIRIEVRDDKTVLCVGAGIGDGEHVHAELVLDEGIGNDEGFFTRDGENFTESAENIELEFREGDEPWLTADLHRSDGEETERQGINLAEHIENQGGELVFT